MFYTYIARCADNSLYTGITNDLIEREKRHNAGIGSVYTSARRPVSIVYHEVFNTRVEAARRESQLKGWTKIKKEKLIKSLHPTKNYTLISST